VESKPSGPPNEAVLSLAAEANGVDKAGMARNSLRPSNIALAVVAAFAMLLIAIFVRNFWLSLVLGVLGTATFAYAALLQREYRRSLPNDDRAES